MQSRTYKKRFTFGTIAVSALALAGVVFGTAAPASAALGNCPSSYLCTWKDSWAYTDGYGHKLQLFQQYISNYNNYNYLDSNHNAGNSATTIYNNGVSETAYMYERTAKRSLLFSIPKGSWNYNLAGNHGDNIESGYYASFN